jgi:hypothetical protein
MSSERNGRVSLSDATFELDPAALQAVDFLQARTMLDALVGKTIVSAITKDGRTSIATADGVTLVFHGFGGVESSPE